MKEMQTFFTVIDPFGEEHEFILPTEQPISEVKKFLVKQFRFTLPASDYYLMHAARQLRLKGHLKLKNYFPNGTGYIELKLLPPNQVEYRQEIEHFEDNASRRFLVFFSSVLVVITLIVAIAVLETLGLL